MNSPKFFLSFMIFAIFVGFSVEIFSEEYISIQPSDAVVQAEGKVPFMVGLVKDGNVDTSALPWDFSFSCSEGSFSGNVYTAPKKPGTYLVRVKYKELLQIAMVSVEAEEAITSIAITPDKLILAPGEEMVFQVKVHGRSGKVVEFSPAWGAKGGKIEKGNYKAGNQPGEFNVVAWGPGGIKAIAVVKIQGKELPVDVDVLVKLEIEPLAAKISGKEKISFKAYSVSQKGERKEVSATWTASSGSIDKEGNFTTREEAGKVTITARYEKLESNVQLEVLPVLLFLTNFSIVEHASKIETGECVEFKTKSKDQFGKDMSVLVQWEASGGTITPDGKFSAEEEGKYQIWARHGKVSTYTEIEVVSAPSIVSQIKIVPESSQIYE